MVLTGGLRLIAGLGFLGAVIALCLWLLNRLFPGTPQNPQSNTSAAVQIAVHPEHKQPLTSGVAQELRSLNINEMKGDRDERANDRHTD